MIGFETSIPPLRTSTTVGIELSKLRKSNQRFDFQKFTLFVRSRFVIERDNDCKIISLCKHGSSRTPTPTIIVDVLMAKWL